jgi:hypothetical protein
MAKRRSSFASGGDLWKPDSEKGRPKQSRNSGKSETTPRKSGITRRRFGEGLFGTAVTAGLTIPPTVFFAKWLVDAGVGDKMAELMSRMLETSSPREATSLSESLQNSPNFLRQLNRHSRAFGNAELAGTLRNGRQRVLHVSEPISRIDYVGAHIMDGVDDAQMPAALREQLQFLSVGLPAVESRYDNGRTSEAGAGRIMQVTENTQDLLNLSDEEVMYLINQVPAMRLHLVSDYEAFMGNTETHRALNTIRDNYFEGDAEKFNREFMPLLLLNTYNGGHPLLQEAITRFASERPSGSERGYDVFDKFAEWSKENDVHVVVNNRRYDYGEASREYAEKIFAFALLLRASDTSVE